MVERVAVADMIDVEGEVEALAMTPADPAWPKAKSGEISRSFPPSEHLPLAPVLL